MEKDDETKKEPIRVAEIASPEGQLGPSGVTSKEFEGAANGKPQENEKRTADKYAITKNLGNRVDKDRRLFERIAAKLPPEGRGRMKQIDRAEVGKIKEIEVEQAANWESDVEKKMPGKASMDFKMNGVPGFTYSQKRRQAERDVAWENARIKLMIKHHHNDLREQVLRHFGLGAEIDKSKAVQESRREHTQEKGLINEWDKAGWSEGR